AAESNSPLVVAPILQRRLLHVMGVLGDHRSDDREPEGVALYFIAPRPSPYPPRRVPVAECEPAHRIHARLDQDRFGKRRRARIYIDVVATDTVSQWAADYRAWADEHLRLLESVYQWYLRKGSWPKIEELTREIWSSEHRRVRLDEILEGRPSPPGRPRWPAYETFTLTVRDLAQLEAAGHLTDLVVPAPRLAVQVYGEPGLELQVRREYMERERITPGQRNLLDRLPGLIFGENPSPFAGGNTGENWLLTVNEASVLRFADVNDLAS